MVVFDIGANNGYYTVMFCEMVGHTGTVSAFEPDPHNYKLLCATMDMNSFDNYDITPFAIHNHVGYVQFGVSDDCAWSGIKTQKATEWIEVNCSTIDNVVLNWCDDIKVDVIKIDIEGTETEAIEGAILTLYKHKPILLIELHGTEEEERNHPLLTMLPALGYNIEYLIDQWFIVATPK
jgi:FkbM family methyltransferase